MAVGQHSPDSGHLFCISLIWNGSWCVPRQGMHRASRHCAVNGDDTAVPLGGSVAEASTVGVGGVATAILPCAMV
jgi:hypothetical protein